MLILPGPALGWLLIAGGAALLGYAYLVYPWIVARLPARPPRPADRPAAAAVTVVIAARRSGRAIADKVSALLALPSTLRLDVVVALDGPDPIAHEALQALGPDRLTVVELASWGGKASALNAGVAQARGEVLVLTDVRQRVTATAIERLVAELASDDVGAVSGCLELARPAGGGLLDWYWRRERELRAAESSWHSVPGVTGALYAIRRESWQAMPAGLILDDVWIALSVVRAGRRVRFAREALVHDVPVGDDDTEFMRKVRTLTGNFQLMALMPWALVPWRNPIWWQFVSHKVLRLATPLASVAVTAGVLVVAGPGALPLALAGVVAAGLVWWLPPSGSPGILRRVHGVLRSALMLHGALLVAAANAVRRRWDVWADPVRPSVDNGLA